MFPQIFSRALTKPQEMFHQSQRANGVSFERLAKFGVIHITSFYTGYLLARINLDEDGVYIPPKVLRPGKMYKGVGILDRTGLVG